MLVAKTWYTKSVAVDTSKILLAQKPTPNWEKYLINKTSSSDGIIVVKTDDLESNNPNYGIISSLVFTYKNGRITSGNVVNVVGGADFIEAQGLELVSKYKDTEIPGFDSGAFMINDVHNNPLTSHTVESGKATANGAMIRNINKASLKSRELSVMNTKRITSTFSTYTDSQTGANGCIDWYLVTYNADTGVILSETYVYTTCNGQGGGGGSTTPTKNPLNPTIVKSLLSKFHLSTLSPDALANFTTTINQMDATADGDKMLSALNAYYIANPSAKTLTVTDDAAADGGNYFDPIPIPYTWALLTRMDTLLRMMYTTQPTKIYHSYETINGQSPYQSNFELDAYMFGAQVIQGLPSDAGTSAYETEIEFQQPTTTAQTQFNTAWTNYLNGNTTPQNYKILDAYFLTGSTVGPNYTTYTGQTVTNNPSSIPLFLK